MREALRQVLAGHEPYPAVLVDRWWELLDGNAGLGLLIEGCAPWLLEPPVNVLRLALHPEGMAPRIGNLARVAGPPADPAPAPGPGSRGSAAA